MSRPESSEPESAIETEAGAFVPICRAGVPRSTGSDPLTEARQRALLEASGELAAAMGLPHCLRGPRE